MSDAAVVRLYRRLAPVYDFVYGLLLQPGRRLAIRLMAPQPGARVLEVGVGTALGTRFYPPHCRVTAVDLSPDMLVRASQRLGRERSSVVRLVRMDARRLAFPDALFDVVYAPYVVNVVDDPVAVVAEMKRVCKPAGQIVLLNHFAGGLNAATWLDPFVDAIAMRFSHARWDVGLDPLVLACGLVPGQIAPANVLSFSSVVVCSPGVPLPVTAPQAQA